MINVRRKKINLFCKLKIKVFFRKLQWYSKKTPVQQQKKSLDWLSKNFNKNLESYVYKE